MVPVRKSVRALLFLALIAAPGLPQVITAQNAPAPNGQNLAGVRAAIAGLKDLNPEKRVTAAEALGRHARAPGAAQIALPALAETVQRDPVSSVRAAAAGAMVEFGAAIEPYGGVLGEYYIQPEIDRSNLNFWLDDLGPYLGGMIPALMQCVADTASVTTAGRERIPCFNLDVFHLLIAMGSAAAPVVPAMIDRLRTGSRFDDYFAVAVGTVGEAAMPFVLELYEADDSRLRYAAAVALGRTKSAKAVAPLLRTLGKPSDATGETEEQIRLRAVAAQSLGRLAGLASGARPQLAAWVNREYDQWGPDSIVSTYAQSALTAIDKNDPSLMGDGFFW